MTILPSYCVRCGLPTGNGENEAGLCIECTRSLTAAERKIWAKPDKYYETHPKINLWR